MFQPANQPASHTRPSTAPNQGQALKKEKRDLQFLFEALLKTKESRTLLAQLCQTLFAVWGNNKGLGRKMATLLGERIGQGFETNLHQTPSLQNEQLLLKILSKIIVYLGPSLDRLLLTLSTQLEELSVEGQKNLLKEIIPSLYSGNSAQLANKILKILNVIHEQDPLFLSQVLRPGVQNWLQELDFGELKETIEKIRPIVLDVFQGMIDTIWKYPAKLVLVLSMLPDLCNLFLELATVLLTNFNTISPDLIADIVLSLFRSLEANTLGKVIQEVSELIRKIHTGSSLIGDPGQAQFPLDLSKFTTTLLEELDPQVLLKAMIALHEDQETIKRTITNTMDDQQEFWSEYFKNLGKLKNPRLRSKEHFWLTLEDNLDQGLDKDILQGLKSMEWQEIAETINSMLLVANQLLDNDPAWSTQIAQAIFNNLDLAELNQFLKHILAQTGAELIPLGRTVLPSLIQTVCEVMEPRDDEFETEMDLARKQLSQLLCTKEVEKSL